MKERSSQASGDNHLSGTPDSWPMSALDAAHAIGVSERTIRRAIAVGKLSATKHGGIYRISPDDLARFRLLLDAVVVPESAINADSSQLSLMPGRMPYPPTPLIGREAERAAASRLLLKEGIRLVTLTGPGGSGKTHLALQVAADIADRFDDGACFVDLSPVRDPDLVLLRIAQAVGVQVAGRHNVGEAIARIPEPTSTAASARQLRTGARRCSTHRGTRRRMSRSPDPGDKPGAAPAPVRASASCSTVGCTNLLRRPTGSHASK